MSNDYSFKDLEETFNRYEIKSDKNKKIVVIDKLSKKEISNNDIINKVKFSFVWFKTMGFPSNVAVGEYDYKTRYNYAFSEKTKELYDNLSKLISEQLTTTGNIEVLDIVQFFKDNKYERLDDVKKLFSDTISVKALTMWFRLANKDSLFPTKSIETYQEALRKLNDKKTL